MMINDELATNRFAGGPYANCPPLGCPAGNPVEARFGQHRDARGRALHRHRPLRRGRRHDVPPPQPGRPSRSARSTRTTSTRSATSTPRAAWTTRRANPDYQLGGLELNCETNSAGDPIACDDPTPLPRAAAAVAARREPWPTLPGRRFLRHCSGLLGCAGGQLDATHDPELDASVASAVLLRDVGHDRTGRPVAFHHQPGRLHTVLNQPSPNGFGALL